MTSPNFNSVLAQEFTQLDDVTRLSNADPDYAAAAFVLKRYSLSHEYCKVAIRELIKKVAAQPLDDSRVAKVQKIADELQAHGVDRGTADRAAAELSDIERRSTIVRLGESLDGPKALDNFLEDLRTGVAAAPVLSIIATWLDQLREEASTQSIPALMSGGLPRQDYDDLPPKPPIGKCKGREEEIQNEPTVLHSSQLLELQARNQFHRIEKFQERFPRAIDLFMFHVEQACCRAAITGEGLEKRLDQAKRIWDEAEAKLRQDWVQLQKQMHAGDSAPLGRSVGDAVLNRHGLLEALGLSSTPSAAGVPLASTPSVCIIDASCSTTRPYCSSARSDIAGSKSSLRPTMVYFPHRKDNHRCVAWILDAPDTRNLVVQLPQFRNACEQRFGSRVISRACSLSNKFVWCALFNKGSDAVDVIASKSLLSVGCLSVTPEALPSTIPCLFMAKISNCVLQDSVRARVPPALSGVASSYQVARYTDTMFVVALQGAKALLRFYVPVKKPSGEVEEACFRAVDAEQPCVLCKRVHRTLCHKAFIIAKST